ncbi:hypothetical protein [Rhizobium sp. MHM7A]|uniref:hypothetical protein n=1 Tax=Rhizobium sp. MHM7A TaxID=2583233 RepID=UPI001105D9FD|nr:hypothetical protein [Rhizobium sp. MHM7A]TLX16000.1 hypothetical protein FFR93_01395 [Rhizobium sp. MHM7A]
MSDTFVADNGKEFEVSEHGQIVGTISVDINDLIGLNLEGALDMFAEKLVGSELLTDIAYTPKGVEDGEIIIEIKGNIEMILDNRNDGPSI